MKINRLEAILVEVPLHQPVTGVHGRTTLQRSVLAHVVADDGREGWGNVDPTPGYSKISADGVQATVGRLAPRVVGMDAFNVQRLLARMDEDAAAESEAKAAVEMAVLDLQGRALGVPVHTLLGGVVRDEVGLNAWIGAVAPAQAAREATAWLGRGFRTAKIKVAGATDEGIERVAAVRAAVGDRLALRVDFNESLTLAESAPFIRRRDDIAGLAAIRRAISVPLMADESVTGPGSLVEIIRREAADIVKLKVMKQGGLLRTRAMLECAAAAGLRVVIGHGFGLTLSTLAEAAVAATSTAVLDGCEAVGPLKMAGDVVTEPVRLDAGVLRLPSSPGLGATVDLDALKRYRVA